MSIACRVVCKRRYAYAYCSRRSQLSFIFIDRLYERALHWQLFLEAEEFLSSHCADDGTRMSIVTTVRRIFFPILSPAAPLRQLEFRRLACCQPHDSRC